MAALVAGRRSGTPARTASSLISAVLFLGVVAAAGCTSNGGTAAAVAPGSPADDARSGGGVGSSTSPAMAGSEPAFDGRIVEITIAGGQAQTAAERVVVALNSVVRLIVTSDVADEVHVHGIDEEFEVQPGETVTRDFVADIPGIFEVEAHGDAGLLFTLQVEP